LRLTVGVADVLPKVLVQQLLKPAFEIGRPIHLVCRQDKVVEDFMGQLAGQELDLVLADRPLGPGIRANAFNHLLGECGTSFLATPKVAAKLRRGFPRSLEGAPCLLPGHHAAVRRRLDQWFESTGFRPTLVAEFDDSALMYAFGEEGQGIFPSPTVFDDEFCRRYNVRVAGRVKSVRQQFYAISVDRRLNHAAVAAIIKGARQDVFVDAS